MIRVPSDEFNDSLNIDMDNIDDISEYVLDKLVDDKSHSHIIIFMCCGQSETEIRILESLRNRGLNIQIEIFFDKYITNRCVSNVTNYRNKYKTMTNIATSFKCLTEFIKQPKYVVSPQYIVLGINAVFYFDTPQELYDCHQFFSYCSLASKNKELHLNWTNILRNTSGNAFPNHERLKEKNGTPIECIRIYTCPWWEYATELVSSKYSESIVVR